MSVLLPPQLRQMLNVPAFALTLMHGALTWLPDGILSVLAALAIFGAVYVVAARFILREEYSYVVRAFLRRGQVT